MLLVWEVNSLPGRAPPNRNDTSIVAVASSVAENSHCRLASINAYWVQQTTCSYVADSRRFEIRDAKEDEKVLIYKKIRRNGEIGS